jgi:aminopeptidase N
MSASLDQDRHISDSPFEFRSQHTISELMRSVGVWLLTAAVASFPGTWAQSSGSGRPSPERRPFAKAGTPRRTERIRFFDVKHIKAELLIDTKKREVRGTVTHSLSPLHPYLKQLELDCGPQLKVSRVTVGPKGNPCTFATKDSKLAVTLDKAYGLGDTIDLAIEYTGSPDRGLYFVLPEAPYPEKRLSFWTQGEAEDTHHWLPCYDYPNERATSEMIITVEKPLFVLSNGTLIETKENDGNTTTYHWKMTVPHSSYLISLAASDFAIYHDRAGDLPVDYYVAKHVDEATARRFMGNTPRMIRFFGDKVGQPFPYAKYAQVCVPDFIAGGMENISATTMTDSALHDEIAELEHQEDGLVAHELAHQWFGDFLTCKDWSHLWLNEGFASYFDPLYAQHDLGDDVFRLEMKGSQDGYIGGDLEYRRPIVESRYEQSDDMFDGVTYSKGACVLHALRGLVGDDAWWRGIKAYVAAHKLDVVETDDLRTAMEAAFGKDLKWFFDQWVYKAGHPELKVRWHYEDADKTVRVRIQQVQTLDDQTPLFRLPTTLEITEDVGKTRAITIVIDGASHEFVIPVASRPKMVQIDPLGWLIKELDFEKDVEENLFQLEHAACILGRLDAARALVTTAKDNPKAAQALAAAWKREKTGRGQREMVEILGNGDEIFRSALMDAARAPDARPRVSAIGGLSKLSRDDAAEALLRAAWTNPKEAYGARQAALRGLAAWKVKDSDRLLADGLANSVDHHALAATALEILLQSPGAKARELAVLYSKYGQPHALRSSAVDAFPRLAKDDPTLQDVLVDLADDSDRFLRLRAWDAVKELRIRKALPVLEARLAKDRGDFGGSMRRVLESAISVLKENPTEAKDASGPTALQAKTIAELESQAADLELKSKELRTKIAALKPKVGLNGQGISGTAATAAVTEPE